jgi:uncharacterized surface protein with fasciclin (FAS1) repeats
MKKLLALLVLVVGLTLAVASNQQTAEEPGTIVDVAMANPDFSTLVTALQEADLVETLQGEGPFTVFAPTDEAFAALPEGALDELLADQEALQAVLLYHVVAGEVTSEEVMALEDGAEVETVEGSPLTVTFDGDMVMVDDATVTDVDIMASNGVIHVIDTVLMPPLEEGASSSN